MKQNSCDREPCEEEQGNAVADIFISYASKDRSEAEAVADALEHQEWSVWWDRTILPGKTFDKAIEQALDEARAVVVLWSSSSIESDWVKEEIADAARKGKLVPALIEDVMIPLGYRRFQAAELCGWDGSGDHPEFQKLAAAIKGIFSPAQTTSSEIQPVSTKPRSRAASQTNSEHDPQWTAEAIKFSTKSKIYKLKRAGKSYLIEIKTAIAVYGINNKLYVNGKFVARNIYFLSDFHFEIKEKIKTFYVRISLKGVISSTVYIDVDGQNIFKKKVGEISED